MAVTEREQGLLDDLSHRVRVITADQCQKLAWPDSKAGRINSGKRVRDLVDRGLLARSRVPARPLLNLGEALQKWEPGMPTPDADALAWKASKRWMKPPCSTIVYFATARTISILGGTTPGRIRNRYQVSHDIHVTQLYLNLRRTDPNRARLWVSEDALPPGQPGEKLPDALLIEPRVDGSVLVTCAIEFAGGYTAKRIRDFHGHCLARNLPYELW